MEALLPLEYAIMICRIVQSYCSNDLAEASSQGNQGQRVLHLVRVKLEPFGSD